MDPPDQIQIGIKFLIISNIEDMILLRGDQQSRLQSCSSEHECDFNIR